MLRRVAFVRTDVSEERILLVFELRLTGDERKVKYWARKTMQVR
jgi:hypothetical protein